jgi:hypothetical protein
MSEPVTIRMFGSLRPMADAMGIPYTCCREVPPTGVSARELATSMGLDAEKIEGVFVNHTVHGLGVILHPGDRIAFVPYDTPGPHRVFLGLYDAGRDENA